MTFGHKLRNVIGTVVGAELLAGVPLVLMSSHPGYATIVLGGVVAMSIPALVAFAGYGYAKTGRIPSGYEHFDVMRPWMRSNTYFNNQAMRQDLDRMTQLAEQEAIRDSLSRKSE